LIALGAGFNPILTGRENIYVNSAVLGRSRAETNRSLDAIIDFADIEESIDAAVQNYSSGMKVRLGFAIAAQLDPQILLVDEVLAVGDSNFQKKCYDRVYEMKRNGTSFIVVSHNPYQLERLCEKVAAMSDGRIVELTDPKAAIHLYHTALRKRKPCAGSPQRVSDGTGQAIIEEVYLTDASGQRTAEVETGSSVSVHARCRFWEDVCDLRLRFCIYSESGSRMLTIGSGGCTEATLFRPGTSTITFAMKRIDLLAGAYSVEAVLTSDRGDRLDRVMDVMRFDVVTLDPAILTRTACTGMFNTDGVWTINDAGR
jgi:energy-coupling factor transporter ATP-binding protein EcfA2